jgi:hypothetical protein
MGKRRVSERWLMVFLLLVVIILLPLSRHLLDLDVAHTKKIQTTPNPHTPAILSHCVSVSVSVHITRAIPLSPLFQPHPPLFFSLCRSGSGVCLSLSPFPRSLLSSQPTSSGDIFYVDPLKGLDSYSGRSVRCKICTSNNILGVLKSQLPIALAM